MASYAGSAIKGAGTGVAMGAAGGPVGAAIGGGLGLIAGLFSAYDAEEDSAEKRKILEQVSKDFNLTQDEVEGLLDEYYNNPDNFLGTAEDVKAYRDMVSKFNPDDYVLDESKITGFGDTYGKTVDDFITPYYDKIIQDTTDRVQHSAAGAGVGRGTGAANAIATAAAEKEDELYRTALQQYNTDRSQSYTEWAGDIDRMQQRLNSLKSGFDTKLEMQNNLANDYTNQTKSYMEDQIAAKQSRSDGNLKLQSMNLNI